MYRGCLTHKPITACYLVIPDVSRIGTGIGIGCAMAFECWVWPNISIFVYVEISTLILLYGNGGVAHTQILLRNDLGTAFVCRHLQLN